jgi:hypothetical protein
MAHYTLIARINAGNGKFPFVNVQFSKNHRPIPIEGAPRSNFWFPYGNLLNLLG